jgi:hypothetical protein
MRYNVRGGGKAYNQINGGSANGDSFVNLRTKYTSVLNYDTYVPLLRAHACARDPTTFVPLRESACPEHTRQPK